jgi:thymidylate synthase (FAD)
MQIKVLNDGFVRLVDSMGNDSSIVQAARVSYGEGTKKISEDRGLIRYLMRNDHTSPFEMCEVKFHVRVPMDCWRQWIRHRTANVNEYSTRYSVAIDATQETDAASWRIQAKDNKQGSAGVLPPEKGLQLTKEELSLHQMARSVYNERLRQGVAREQARKDLPLSTYTEAYWKCDLHNIFNFLRLRLDSHAQLEIREYAQAVGDIIKSLYPLAWEAFSDYKLNSMRLSNMEVNLLTSGSSVAAADYSEWLKTNLPSKMEREEFLAKKERLGL